MISLIITIRNEMPLFREWFSSIDAQIIQPDDIVIVDGGSTDGTWEYVQEEAKKRHNVRVMQQQGNIAMGRNAALSLAKGDIVAVTDAGCMYDPAWLRDLMAPIVSGSASISATAFAPWLYSSDGVFLRAIAAATMPSKKEFEKDWLPSSRSFAFRKEVVQKAGGYPAWIPFCEDVLLDKALLKAGETFAYVRATLVYWRPRLTLCAYMKQVANYTRSEAHASLNILRHGARHAMYIFFPLGLLLLSGYYWYTLFFGGILVFCVYMIRYFLRAVEYARHTILLHRINTVILTPAVVVFGDVAKIVGWWRGIFEKRNIKRV